MDWRRGHAGDTGAAQVTRRRVTLGSVALREANYSSMDAGARFAVEASQANFIERAEERVISRLPRIGPSRRMRERSTASRHVRIWRPPWFPSCDGRQASTDQARNPANVGEGPCIWHESAESTLILEPPKQYSFGGPVLAI